MIKKLISLLLAALFIFVLTACGPRGAAAPAARTGEPVRVDSLTVVVAGEPATLDSSRANHENISLIFAFIGDGLFQMNSDGTYSTRLAESWEMEDDVTMRIRLKPGIRFSDGSPLTAHDVLWHYIRTSQQAVSRSQFMFIDPVNSFVEDDLNLVLRFTQPWSPAINSFATGRGMIPSKAAYERMDEAAFSRAPVMTGPFRVVNWVSGSHITLAANEYYWRGTPNFRNVTIRFIGEPASRVIELETGGADIAFFIEGSDIARVNAIPGYSIVLGDSFRYFVLILSMQEPLFQNRDVRVALTYAIDQHALVEAVTDGIGTVIYTMGPPLVIEGMMEMPPIPFDVARARELMAGAGFPNGFTIELHVEPQPIFQRMAEVIQAMWAEIGVQANIVVSTLATHEAQTGGRWQASIRDGTAQVVENVWTIYESAFGSRMQGNDPWIDENLLRLRAHYAGDPIRYQLLEEMANHLFYIRFTYPIMTMPSIYGVSDNLRGFEFYPSPGALSVWNWALYR